jgi:hypothetical protein
MVVKKVNYKINDIIIIEGLKISSIKRIDQENTEFYSRNMEAVASGKLTIRDIIGFDLNETPVFVAPPRCGHWSEPTTTHCSIIEEKSATSIFSLLPLYDQIVYSIPPVYGSQLLSLKNFEESNGLTFQDFKEIVHTGKIIPYFPAIYGIYDSELIKHFLEPGIPRISVAHMRLIKNMNRCKIVKDCKICKGLDDVAKEDTSEINKKDSEVTEVCSSCLRLAYQSGISRDNILRTNHPKLTLCNIPEIIASRNIGAVFKSSCPAALETLNLFASFLSHDKTIETIITGLKVRYTNDIDLQSYLSILDGKTTRAVREAVRKILADPFVTKNTDRLSSKIFIYNKEIEEVARTKAAKFFNAVSEIAVYGGNKFVERQTQGLVKSGDKYLHKIQEWIASGLIDIHARVTGRDWTFAQLYKARCRIEKCRKKTTD